MRSIIRQLFIGAILAFGLMLYFVYEFTRIYPPLKQYDYPGNITQLNNHLTRLSLSHPKITFEITDTTGNKEKGYAYYIDIKVTGPGKSNKYDLSYRKDDSWWEESRYKINLVGAFDDLKNTGGYQMKDKDVKRLVQLFEKDFYNILMPPKGNSS